MSSWERAGIVSLQSVRLKPKRMEWIKPVDFAVRNLACTEMKTFLKLFFFCCVCISLTAELKTSLSTFIERETTLDYDREAEQALQRITTGAIDLNQLTDVWTRSYVEVITHMSIIVVSDH